MEEKNVDVIFGVEIFCKYLWKMGREEGDRRKLESILKVLEEGDHLLVYYTVLSNLLSSAVGLQENRIELSRTSKFLSSICSKLFYLELGSFNFHEVLELDSFTIRDEALQTSQRFHNRAENN